MSERGRWTIRLAWLAAVVAVGAARVPARAMDEPGPLREAALARLVRHDCGSCHGMTLLGGLGPALTPTTLHGRSADGLAWVIANGRADRAMPGWAPILSAHEIDWIAKGLLEGRFLPAEAP